MMGTTRSELGSCLWTSGAVMVSTPSDERVDEMSLGLMSAVDVIVFDNGSSNNFLRNFYVLFI